ncbi:MAG: winged helix-turn-helix domain-containing protein [Owenweeksia sp.]|nr:winged helix-turn-helix domain-containing protein [Owenweeksia sp.]
MHVRKLREKIGQRDYIRTVKGVGYQLEILIPSE